MSETMTRVAEHARAQLRIEMARRDLSNVELAGLIGVSDMWVSRRRNGQTPLSLEDLELLARVFDVPVQLFLPASERVG